MNYRRLFWLHIKKSAGSTTRELLQPHYLKVDRTKKPKCFIQATPEEYNDILNNYRVVLGDYQFRRCLFAKTYLYPDAWDDHFSFAFSRNPIDRCISMFFYLFWRPEHRTLRSRVRNSLRESKKAGELRFYTMSYAFDVFLDNARKARSSRSIYRPVDEHFTTHTAPMWEDITDLDGNILLKKIFRLENLGKGINQAFEECGLEKRIEVGKIAVEKNRNHARIQFEPTQAQIKKIEEIYQNDFNIYEGIAL